MSYGNNDSASSLNFEIAVKVLSATVEIKVKNMNGPMKLNENLVIEKWSEVNRKWIFAACPLWVCGTKETVFSRDIAAGEIANIIWNKNLHSRCQKAMAGKYRVLIKDYNDKILSKPAEFLIVEKWYNKIPVKQRGTYPISPLITKSDITLLN